MQQPTILFFIYLLLLNHFLSPVCISIQAEVDRGGCQLDTCGHEEVPNYAHCHDDLPTEHRRPAPRRILERLHRVHLAAVLLGTVVHRDSAVHWLGGFHDAVTQALDHTRQGLEGQSVHKSGVVERVVEPDEAEEQGHAREVRYHHGGYVAHLRAEPRHASDARNAQQDRDELAKLHPEGCQAHLRAHEHRDLLDAHPTGQHHQ